jgi:hypothetical protein
LASGRGWAGARSSPPPGVPQPCPASHCLPRLVSPPGGVEGVGGDPGGFIGGVVAPGAVHPVPRQCGGTSQLQTAIEPGQRVRRRPSPSGSVPPRHVMPRSRAGPPGWVRGVLPPTPLRGGGASGNSDRRPAPLSGGGPFCSLRRSRQPCGAIATAGQIGSVVTSMACT